MSIETMTESARAYARDRKLRVLADAGHLLVVLRDGDTTAALSSGDLNLLIRLAETAAAGYAADTLALVIEGVLPLVETNPVTGGAWQRGEAERVWLEHNGVEQGWVTETQIIAIALRTGETVEEGWPFRLVDDSVAWAETPLPLSRTGLAEALAIRMDRPVADVSRVPDPGDGFAGDPDNGPFYDAEYGRVALDIGCTRILGNQLLGNGEACLIVRGDDRADYLIGEGLPSWQIEVYADDGE